MTPALLVALDTASHLHLIVGSNSLAAARCRRSLDVGAVPTLVAPEPENLHHGLTKRVEEDQVRWLRRDFQDTDLTTLGRDEVDNFVDAVFVTSGAKTPQAAHIAALCKRLRIPVNVADSPNLSTFTVLSTHTSGPLQVGVTTSGRGCKLASRIRREIASALPSDLGSGVERLGAARRKILEQDHASEVTAADMDCDDDESGQTATFNKLVTSTDSEAAKARRLRWLAQICEYWPLRKLAAITDEDVDGILEAYRREMTAPANTKSKTSSSLAPTLDPLVEPAAKKARIILAGSGPGHPSLLTLATYNSLQTADVILADKLVPSAILSLIPRRATVHIARKFPGNAEQAQDELHSLALDALRRDSIVLRLKQGDPFLYGRGAEEVAFFRARGYAPVVLPGITSALAAPLFADIPVTHREVSDGVLVCTGTGRKGAAPAPPKHEENRTLVFLMALHRLAEVVGGLLGSPGGSLSDSGAMAASNWPATTPCAVIERASCPDQRVIRTTLRDVAAAVEEEGSRPPGLLVVGKACEVLKSQGGKKWIVEEGWRGLEFFGNGADGGGLLDGVLQVRDDTLGRLNSSLDASDPVNGALHLKDDGGVVNGVNGHG